MIRLVAASLMALTGCAVSMPAPEEYRFDNSRTFDVNMDDLWEEVVEFFAENNLPISIIERDSGLIVSNDLRFSNDAEFNQYADCGVRAEDLGNLRRDSGTGDVNIFIRERSTGNVEVTVNSRFGLFREVQTTIYVSKSFDCVSKGVLESTILDRITTGISLPTVNFE